MHPVAVLAHGFAGSLDIAWRATGVLDRLHAAAIRTVAYDARGHGRSDKPHEEARYGDARMARDLAEIVDHFAGRDAVVVGYSMGAAVSLHALASGLEVRAAVIGAAAPAVLEWREDDEAMRAAAVRALRNEGAIDDVMRGWLDIFAAIGADFEALACVLTQHRPVIDDWEAIRVPTIVVAGDGDTLAAPPQEIAARLPKARAAVVPGDHLTAPIAPEFSALVTEALLEDAM